jgi:hypothetical protein
MGAAKFLQKEYKIPLKRQEGWVTRSIEIIENASADSVRLGSISVVPPKWTGMLYSNDEIGAEPTTIHYKPSKGANGFISTRYRVSK